MATYSVIVPAYNSENTLARCLDSLLTQNRQDIRILVIDDGSEDQTGNIARSFCEKSSLIEYHRQENAGVSAARNQGLSLVRSEFVCFVDSDDYIMPGYFEVLDRIAGSDLLVFDRCFTGGALRDDTEIFRRLSQLDSTEKRLELLMQSKKIMQPWNKCFRMERIRRYDLRFPEQLHIAEDFVFCMAYAVRCRSIAVSTEKPYCIDVSDSGSLSRRYRPDLAEQLVQAAELVERSILDAGLGQPRTQRLLARLDQLHTRNMLMSIAEEFKAHGPNYLRHAARTRHICALFRREYSPVRLGRQHAILRRMLGLRLYGGLYLLAYLVRGRGYRTSGKELGHG